MKSKYLVSVWSGEVPRIAVWFVGCLFDAPCRAVCKVCAEIKRLVLRAPLEHFAAGSGRAGLVFAESGIPVRMSHLGGVVHDIASE